MVRTSEQRGAMELYLNSGADKSSSTAAADDTDQRKPNRADITALTMKKRSLRGLRFGCVCGWAGPVASRAGAAAMDGAGAVGGAGALVCEAGKSRWNWDQTAMC